MSVAEAIWAAYQGGAIEAPKVAPLTLDELAVRVCERDGLSTRTRHGYRQVWSQFARHLGKRPPARIYPTDVRGFLAGFAGATRDRYLRELRATLRHAVAQGWLVEDPTAGLRPEYAHTMGAWLPSSEWPAFLAACSPAHRIRCGFVLETGLRAGELAAARWSWIHGQVGRRAIRVVAEKTDSTRAVPLTRDAQRWLDEAARMWPRSGDSHICFGRRAR